MIQGGCGEEGDITPLVLPRLILYVADVWRDLFEGKELNKPVLTVGDIWDLLETDQGYHPDTEKLRRE